MRQGRSVSARCQFGGGGGQRSYAAAVQLARRCPSEGAYAGWQGSDNDGGGQLGIQRLWPDISDGDTSGRHFPCRGRRIASNVFHGGKPSPFLR